MRQSLKVAVKRGSAMLLGSTNCGVIARRGLAKLRFHLGLPSHEAVCRHADGRPTDNAPHMPCLPVCMYVPYMYVQWLPYASMP